MKEKQPGKAPWWDGMEVQCLACGAVYELESSDRPVVVGPRFYAIKCENCGREMPVERPLVTPNPERKVA